MLQNQPEYEVECILKKRVRKYGKGMRVEYLVHWKGYPNEDDTWEPRSNLDNCQDMLMEFEASINFIAFNPIYVI